MELAVTVDSTLLMQMVDGDPGSLIRMTNSTPSFSKSSAA